jgi:fused signal recognition particle receptor
MVRRTPDSIDALMLTTTGVVILVLILAFAAFLLALPGVLGRRERRRRAEAEADADVAEPAIDAPDAATGERLESGLASSRKPFRTLRDRWRARRLDDEAWEDLEETLLLADVGVPMTARLLESLRARARRDGVRDADGLTPLLEAEITAAFDHPDRALHLEPGRPNVWLLVGVNGVGKTTTAAKLARREREAGRRVLLVAADTFRAAAADQLAAWGASLGVDVLRGQEGGDPASVVFDAVQAAQARGVDVVLVDTAGRLHTKRNLMEELAKIRRIVDRFPDALAEVLLVLDATTGQNGLVQAREFAETVGVTGVVLAKLDGTARGGIVLAVESELGAPVKLVGVGETADDLVAFEPAEFAAALVG